MNNITLDECFQFGLGAFETIGIEKGTPILLEKHLKRLERAADFLKLGDPAVRGESGTLNDTAMSCIRPDFSTSFARKYTALPPSRRSSASSTEGGSGVAPAVSSAMSAYEPRAPYVTPSSSASPSEKSRYWPPPEREPYTDACQSINAPSVAAGDNHARACHHDRPTSRSIYGYDINRFHSAQPTPAQRHRWLRLARSVR